jgi:sensor c-di-GMP phosphodiesterase-like protein
MKHTAKQRVLIIVAATAIASVAGVGVGYLMGRALALRLAEGKLVRDAAYVVKQGDAFSDESRALLATLQASPYAFCSETELAYFRKLLFQSKYLRDAGRMRDGTIVCSATMSRAELPVEQFKPDISQPDGTQVFGNLPPFRAGKLRGILIELGDSYVVYAPNMGENRDGMSSHVLITSTGTFSPQYGENRNGLSKEDAKVFTVNGFARVNDSLYATRCSARYFRCASTYLSIPEVLASDRIHRTLGAVLGGVIGALAGLFFPLLYRRNRSIEHQLRRAISKDKVRLVYQPIVDLSSQRITGAEALARWTDEEGFAVGPDVFVCIAEKYGFVGDLTRLVVRRALRDFAETLKEYPDFRLSINVAAADLSDPAFLPMLEEALARSGVQSGSLAIEITESSTARHEVAREAILCLRQRGHSVHVDDFGTGYSSLSYLHDLSIDTIKIDRSFTQAIGTQAVTVGILPQILAMAAVLKLDVIVEGVETSQQANYFNGADRPIFAQGWLFGRPVSPDAFRSLLDEDMKRAVVSAEASEDDTSNMPFQVA